MRCASPLGLGGTVLADAVRFREGGRGTVRCFLAMAFPLQSGFPASKVFPPPDRHIDVSGVDLEVKDGETITRRAALLPEVRRGGKVVDPESLLRHENRHDERLTGLPRRNNPRRSG